jgi:hypothetical protein
MDGGFRPRRAGFILTDKPGLVGLCVGAAVVEAGLLAGLGATWASGLAPQVSAAAPFGVFHDLRWLVVYHQSLAAFLLELVALLAFRSTFDALVIRAAWPREALTLRPTFLRAWLRAFTFTLVAAVLMAPWVMLLFGMAVVSLSWLFFAAVPPVLAVAALTGAGPVSSDWWRRTVPPRSVGWVALTFLVMSASSGVIGIAPVRLGVPVAVLGGLFNAWAWRGVVGAVTSPLRSQRFLPVAPAALALVLVVVAGGTSIGFAVSSAKARHQRAQAVLAAATQVSHRPDHGAPVLIASGFGTKWDGRSGPWLDGPFDETRFSYTGLNEAGQARAYGPQDTVQSLDDLDRAMAVQVQTLARRDHHKVAIVAASEASLVAETFLARYPRAPVDSVVLLSPLVTPGRAYYPPAGSDGWGVVGRLGLEALTNTIGSISPLEVSPSTPLFQSMVADAPAIRSLIGCPTRGIMQVALEPVADAVAAPTDPASGIPTVVFPAFHSGTLGDPQADALVIDVLEHRAVPSDGPWGAIDQVLRPVAGAWQVPQLSLRANPDWDLGSGTVIEPDGDASCSSARKLLLAEQSRASDRNRPGVIFSGP